MNKHTILAVDDDPITRKILEIALQARNYPAQVVSSGQEAISALQTGNFDILITDLHMSEIDGFTVLEKTRELSPSTIRIVITSSQDVSAAIKAIEIGVDGYQLKPFSVGELLFCIDRAMSKSESKRSKAVKNPKTSMVSLPGIKRSRPTDTDQPTIYLAE
ncbi:MAG: response regulator [Desulforhopalus sp.]